mmetsp:Transcript_4031/g.14052  ORF Transcript_4031/g.14052 Transcript_4031/m.14052 type:complete len:382 (-) Transcript_4031:75-1220(-)
MRRDRRRGERVERRDRRHERRRRRERGGQGGAQEGRRARALPQDSRDTRDGTQKRRAGRHVRADTPKVHDDRRGHAPAAGRHHAHHARRGLEPAHEGRALRGGVGDGEGAPPRYARPRGIHRVFEHDGANVETAGGADVRGVDHVRVLSEEGGQAVLVGPRDGDAADESDGVGGGVGGAVQQRERDGLDGRGGRPVRGGVGVSRVFGADVRRHVEQHGRRRRDRDRRGRGRGGRREHDAEAVHSVVRPAGALGHRADRVAGGRRPRGAADRRAVRVRGGSRDGDEGSARERRRGDKLRGRAHVEGAGSRRRGQGEDVDGAGGDATADRLGGCRVRVVPAGRRERRGRAGWEVADARAERGEGEGAAGAHRRRGVSVCARLI